MAEIAGGAAHVQQTGRWGKGELKKNVYRRRYRGWGKSKKLPDRCVESCVRGN